MKGKIEPPNALFLTLHCGEATTDDGTVLEIGYDAGGGSALVQNTVTHRTYVLTWKEIVDMAIESGILEVAPAEATEQ